MNDESSKFVRYVPGPITAEQVERMRKLAERPDSEIDFSISPSWMTLSLRMPSKARCTG
jgi:hypothetical protein